MRYATRYEEKYGEGYGERLRKESACVYVCVFIRARMQEIVCAGPSIQEIILFATDNSLRNVILIGPWQVPGLSTRRSHRCDPHHRPL